MSRYISEHPQVADWISIEAKVRRELKRLYGIDLHLKRDLKPHGHIRRTYGQYSIHANQKNPCVVKNLTIEMLRDNLDDILNSIPERLPNGIFPHAEANIHGR